MKLLKMLSFVAFNHIKCQLISELPVVKCTVSAELYIVEFLFGWHEKALRVFECSLQPVVAKNLTVEFFFFE